MWVDDEFFSIISELKSKSENELFLNMRNCFLTKVPIPIQDVLSDYWSKYPYWGSYSFKENNFDIFHQKAKVFKKYVDDIVWLYNRLEDYRSKFVLYAVLSNFYYFDFECLKKAKEQLYSQYFDLDILHNVSDEIFVDVGTYYGETILDFIKCFGEDSYKKIYGYEITPVVVEKAKKNLSNFHNIEIFNKAVGESTGKVFLKENSVSNSANQVKYDGEIEIDKISLDEDIKSNISMIKMDIEGGEINAIKGCEKHIRNDCPKLMLSAYHSNSDFVVLPKIIESIRNDYKFYFRYYGGNLYATELVLYCI